MPDYGKQHKRLRAYLLARYIPGVTLCARCSLPITTLRSRDIHLGHDDHNPLAWRGLEHARCNTSAGATMGNKARPPTTPRMRRTRRRSRIW